MTNRPQHQWMTWAELKALVKDAQLLAELRKLLLEGKPS